MVHAIAEGEVDDAVCADLLDGGHAAGFQGFAETGYEVRGCCCCCSGVLGDMAAEAGVDD